MTPIVYCTQALYSGGDGWSRNFRLVWNHVYADMNSRGQLRTTWPFSSVLFLLRMFQKQRVFKKWNQFLSILYKYCEGIFFRCININFPIKKLSEVVSRKVLISSNCYEEENLRNVIFYVIFVPFFTLTNFWVISVYFLKKYFCDTLHIIVFNFLT